MSTQWPLKRLGEVVSLDATTARPDELSDRDLYVGLENIASDGSLIGLGQVSAADLKSNKNRFDEGSVLFGKLRPYLAKVVRPETSGVCSTDILVLAPSSEIDRNYLYWWLRSPAVIEEATSKSTGATLPRISPSTLASFQIPVPPLAEQQRIVDKLDRIWHAIDATADANVSVAGLTQDVLDAALTEHFGNLFERHSVSRLGDVLEIARGGSPRPISEFLTEDEDGVNWIKIGDASASRKYIHSTRERIKPSGVSRSRMVYEGDFLLSNSMSFGRPYIMRTTGCIHDGWLVLRDKAKKFDQDFLYYLLGSRLMYDEFSKRAQGSTVQNLNSSLVADVRVPVPPLDVQVEVSAFAREIEESAHKLGEIYLSKSSKLETYRQSILEAAFRGEL